MQLLFGIWILCVEFCMYYLMCGRFIQISDPEKIKAGLFDLEVDVAAVMDFRPRYNIAPTQKIITILNTPTPKLTLTRWGLIPFWAKDMTIGNKLINARAETLMTKPSFKNAFHKRRCIIISDGFYEWKGAGKTKTPFFIRLKDKMPMGFAGLWDIWTDKHTNQEILSSSIITTEANPTVAHIHNRMPVILDPDHYKVWLHSDFVQDSILTDCLNPYIAKEMEAYEVSRLVNNPQNDSAECIRPV
jgi:putative SOS response-associated peptidase YedK